MSRSSQPNSEGGSTADFPEVPAPGSGPEPSQTPDDGAHILDNEEERLRRVREGSGLLTAAALRRLDADLSWYRDLHADDRSWIGLVVQSGISSFVAWYADPTAVPSGVSDIFAAAPPELTRSISLQHTLQLVRVIVEVVETHSDQLAVPGGERDLREAVLRYSREVAFSAAEVYARAAEMRGAWDARLEALVVDALVRGDSGDDSLRSRVAALGWSGHGSVLVMVGTTTTQLEEVKAAELRRATRRAVSDSLVGVQADRVILVLGGRGDLQSAAQSLVNRFGPGPVVIGPVVPEVAEAGRSAKAALAGLAAAAAWPQAPRPVQADDLLPERVLIGDRVARATLVEQAYLPLAASTGSVLETLSAYLGTGRSLEAAARGLFVHPNTVRYRLRKVAELTGWDPLDARESFVLQIALALGELNPRAAGHL